MIEIDKASKVAVQLVLDEVRKHREENELDPVYSFSEEKLAEMHKTAKELMEAGRGKGNRVAWKKFGSLKESEEYIREMSRLDGLPILKPGTETDKGKEKTVMEFKDTVEMMLSDDYKERFKAEYYQTKERYERLKRFNTRIEAAHECNGVYISHCDSSNAAPMVKMPKHSCSDELLNRQQGIMGEYLHILEIRAVIEGIEL